MKYSLKKNTFDVDVEDKKIVLNADSGEYVEINYVGKEIFEMLKKKPMSTDEILIELKKKFNSSDEKQMKEEIEDFLTSRIFTRN